MTFEEKVRSMTGKEIMQAMIDGLKKEWVEVNMNTFGGVETKTRFKFFTKKTCFGCAATNAICQIHGKAFTPETIYNRAIFLNVEEYFVHHFETAINALRLGSVKYCNRKLELIGAQLIPEIAMFLPELTNENYMENLHYYQEYCDALP